MIIGPGLLRGGSRFVRGREVFRRLNPTRYVAPSTLSSPFALTRAQASSILSSSLGTDNTTWSTFAADTARYYGSPGSLLIEGQRTNSIRNPRGEGGTTFPSNWSIFSANGVATSIAGRGTQDGRNYVDIRFSGTTTNTFFVQVFDNSAASITAGQVAAGAVWVSLAAGSQTGIGFTLSHRWSTGATTGQFYTVTGTPQRFVLTATAPASTTSVFFAFGLTFAAGAAIDVTYRFSWPQLEVNSPFVSTPILPPVGAPAASTRGGDLVSASLASLGIGSNGACTVLWAGRFFNNNFNVHQTIVGIDDNTANNRYELRIGQQAQATDGLIGNGGVLTTFGGVQAVPTNTLIRAGMVVNGAGRFAIAAANYDNSVAFSSGSGPTAGLLTMRLGNSGTTSARPMVGGTEALYVSPTPLSDGDLAAAVLAMPI